MKIPFLDLVTPHLELEEEIVSAIRSALRCGRFVGGPEVEAFEDEFARFCGVGHCAAVGSGTDALRFALIAAGIQKGDRVLTAPNTFIATTEAITQAGGTADFVDADQKTYNLDPAHLENYLRNLCEWNEDRRCCIHRSTGDRVWGVVPVHLYGQMADMDAVMEIATRYRLAVIEDACQAHGAGYFSKRWNKWVRAGAVGRAAAFSFYPGKNLGACGEGGAVVSQDPALIREVRVIRDHGQSQKYHHEREGYNGRCDAIQCGILRIKLRLLDEWNEKRRAAAGRYAELLSRIELVIPPSEPPWSRAVYHIYAVRAFQRDRLREHLTALGIGTGLHYPQPLHLQTAYAGRGFRAADFPVASATARELLSLPMFPQITPAQQSAVAGAIASFYSERRASSSGLEEAGTGR